MKPYYEADGIVIYHGKAEEVLPTLNGIGLVFTSPPYNLERSLEDTPNEAVHTRARPGFRDGQRKQRFADGYDEHDDGMPWAQYLEFQHEVIRGCWDALNDTGAIYYVHKPRVQRLRCQLPTDLVPPEIPLRQVIIWDRRTKGMAWSTQAYNTGHEWIVLLAKPAFTLRDRSASSVSDIWRFPPDMNSEHPCPFPLGLPATAIETAAFTGPVLDPFAGSGTTLVAAKQAGLNAVGIEMSERYCEIAAKRLQSTAVNLFSTAESFEQTAFLPPGLPSDHNV